MQQGDLHGVRVALIVHDEFEQDEMTEPRKALEQAGATVTLISPIQGQVHGMKHATKVDSFRVDMPLDQARPEDFDAIMLPGGALNADKLRMDQKARELVQRFDREGKPIAAICHAPWLLISAGVVKGRNLTSYYTIQDDVRNAGGKWLDQEVIRDGNLVTSRQPSDFPAFNREMVRLFSEGARKGRRAA